MDWSFVRPFISCGRMPNFRDPAGYRETIISEAIARCLGLDTVGGYSTQLTDFDARYIFARMAHLQRVNGCDSTKIGCYEVHARGMADADGAVTLAMMLGPSAIVGRMNAGESVRFE